MEWEVRGEMYLEVEKEEERMGYGCLTDGNRRTFLSLIADVVSNSYVFTSPMDVIVRNR